MKNTLVLVAFYLAVIGAFAALQFQQIRGYSTAVQLETARLIGRDIAAAMTEPSLERLIDADPAAREEFRSIIAGVVGGSDVITSISVMNRQGKVVASDQFPVGQEFHRPDHLFSGKTPRFFVESSDPLRGGRYLMEVPLILNSVLIGYLRIDLDGAQVAERNRRALVQLLFVSLAGLVLVVVVASLLQSGLNLRVRELVRALDAAGRGESHLPRAQHAEFAPVLEAAARVGQTLREERAIAAARKRSLDVLAQAFDVGLLLFRPDGSLEFANGGGQSLFQSAGVAELDERLRESAPNLGALLKSMDPKTKRRDVIDIDLRRNGQARTLRLDLWMIGGLDCEGFLGLIRDRAALRALETDLRLAAHLRELSRTYVTTAHDIRAPLNALVLNLELLARSVGSDGDPSHQNHRRRYIEVMDSELQRLIRMLEGLMSQAQLTGNTMETFDVGEVVMELLTLLEPAHRECNVQVRIARPEAPVYVEGNRDSIKQALLNILNNGLDAMKEGGELNVELQESGETARLSIRDTGPGISPEMADRLFTMHATTKPSGTGMGLYVAQSVVEAHGGWVRVQSAPGEGARFEIGLPTATRGADYRSRPAMRE